MNLCAESSRRIAIAPKVMANETVCMPLRLDPKFESTTWQCGSSAFVAGARGPPLMVSRSAELGMPIWQKGGGGRDLDEPLAPLTPCEPSSPLHCKVAIPGSLVIDESWSFEDIHDDLAAKIVNEVGVPVMLSQLYMGKSKTVVPALAVFKDVALKAAAEKAAVDCRIGSKVAGGPVLTLRKEQQQKTMREKRQAKTKPNLSLQLTNAG